jgi:single-stranded-DNA-specific exonuclease
MANLTGQTGHIEAAALSRPKVYRRTVDPRIEAAALSQGADPLLARIVAGRLGANGIYPVDRAALDRWLQRLITPKLAQLDHPASLPDIDRAAARLSVAIDRGERIGLATDHDADGVTSCAVLTEALTQIFGHPVDKIDRYVAHRLNEGYGLNDRLAERILRSPQRPTLLITADNGSSDEPRIALLAAAGVDVLVTDHHELPRQGGQPLSPASAYAVVTPLHPHSRYPDRQIAGCMVAWLLMAHLFHQRWREGKLAPDQGPLKALLGFVAIGTVADCVSLAASVNNRAVVRAGIEQIQTSNRPAWQQLRESLCSGGAPLRAETLAFQVCPRLASPGRLDVADPGIQFLLAPQLEEAKHWWDVLTESNEARKLLSQRLQAHALELARLQVANGRHCLVLPLGDVGHAGVQGLVATKAVQEFGRPTVVLSPKTQEPHVVTGSCRSVPGIHIRDVLQAVEELAPGLMRFGGHEAAAGLTIHESNVERLGTLLEQVVRSQDTRRELTPAVYTDGDLPEESLSLDLLDRLRTLEPYGQRFETPSFVATLSVQRVRPCGPDGRHLQLSVRTGGQRLQAVWFSAREPQEAIPVVVGQTFRAIVQLGDNYWRGRKLQLVVQSAVDASQLQWTPEPVFQTAEASYPGSDSLSGESATLRSEPSDDPTNRPEFLP